MIIPGPSQAFPGKEFTTEFHAPGETEYFYELSYVHEVHTTSGQRLYLPDIEHRVYAEFSNPDFESVDQGARILPASLLDETQAAALQKAQVIKAMREAEDPNLSNFSYIRRVARSAAGLLYLCNIEDFPGPPEREPYAAVKTITALGDAVFVTGVFSSRLFFEYHPADLETFVPEGIEPNAYAFIDNTRVIAGGGRAVNRQYQLARVRFYHAEADMDYPVENVELA